MGADSSSNSEFQMPGGRIDGEGDAADFERGPVFEPDKDGNVPLDGFSYSNLYYHLGPGETFVTEWEKFPNGRMGEVAYVKDSDGNKVRATEWVENNTENA